MQSLESKLERSVFASRGLLAPFFCGLVIAIAALLIKFGNELLLVPAALGLSDCDVIISILMLGDTTLIAGLLLIIMLSGYENFVSKIGVEGHEDRPAWIGKVGFSDLKIKLMGAIVAISAVELLKAFVHSDTLDTEQLAWRVGIHLTFVVSAVLFAVTDRITKARIRVTESDAA